MKKTIVGLIMCMLMALIAPSSSADPFNNVCIEGSGTNCALVPEVAFLTITNSPITVCAGQQVSLCATYTNIPGSLTIKSTNIYCVITTSNLAVQATVVSNWWLASVGTFSAGGSNLCAVFTPTNSGNGSLTFGLVYVNEIPCDGAGPSTVTNTIVMTVNLESGPHTNAWSCIQQGTTNSMGSLSYTNLNVCVGETIVPPDVSGVSFNNGKKSHYIYYDCPQNQSSNHWETNDVIYTNSAIYFEPSIPGSITNVSTNEYIAKVDGIALDGVCSNITGIILGTVIITVTPCSPCTNDVVNLINIDFGGGTNSTKTGFAAIGHYTNDFWNHFTSPYQYSGSRTNLKRADGSVTSVGLLATNTPGVWGNGSPDPMYDDYIYPWEGESGSVTLTNLPAGVWEVFAYSQDGNYELTVGTNSYGIRTTLDEPLLDPLTWQEGVQYAHFTNVSVSAGQSLKVILRPGIHNWAIISGMQLLLRDSGSPIIITQPVSLTNCPGSTATFNVTATGSGPISYFWRFGTNVLVGKTNNSLVITNIATTNAGTYSVTVTGPCGVVTNSATMTVLTNLVVSGPVSLTNCPGSTATFNVTATGSSPISYLWKLGANVLTGKTNNSLTITNIVTTNAGTYSVIVAGPCGNVTNSAKLTVLNNLTVSGPGGLVKCPGSTATFTVTATGSNPISYLWKLGTNVLTGKTNSSLTITNIVTTNAGTYSVIVAGPCGNVTNSATLTVLSNLTVSGPVSLTNCPGSTATFNVTATGSSPISYFWKLGANVLTGKTNSTLVITNVAASDSGTYSAIVAGPCGNVTNSATLTVLSNLTVSGPVSLTNCPGSTATFNVTATGSSPISYLWRFGTNVLVGKTNNSLVITNIATTNAGTYSVTVTGLCGNVTNSAVLAVNLESGPHTNAWTCIQQGTTNSLGSLDQTNINVCMNETIIKPVVSGATFNNGKKSRYIYYDCPNNTNVNSWETNDVTYTNTVVYFEPPIPNSITNVATNIYTAKIDAIAVGGVCSSLTGIVVGTVTITTFTAPIINLQPTNQTVVQGTNVTFSSAAIGLAPLRYQWFFNGTNSLSGATNASLVLTNLQLNQAGYYSVRVTNSCGTANSTNGLLTVVGVGAIVVDNSAPLIQGSNSVCLMGQTTLRVSPNPANASFPSGYPKWIVTNPTNGTTSFSGVLTNTVTNTLVGQYTIQSSCGTSTNTFTLLSADPADTDYDGVGGCQEIIDGTDPNNPNEVTSRLLGSWRFDTTNWFGQQGQTPLDFTNLFSVPGVISNAVRLSTNALAFLAYREADSAIANINVRKGSISFWFRPEWSSTNSGTGPTNEARLIEMGNKGSSNGCWGLYIDPKGTNLYFCSQTNAASPAPIRTNVVATINWSSNNWQFIALTYSSNLVRLYVNGTPVATNNIGVTNWPGFSTRTNGFCVGSSRGGTNQCRGRCDNLNTYNYVLSDAAIFNEFVTTCFSAMDVMMVIDRSGSMNNPTNKLADAKTAATNFVTHLDWNLDKAGVLSFSSSTTTNQTLTTNSTNIIAAITNLSSGGNTRIDLALSNAVLELASSRRNSNALPVIVLLSDGANVSDVTNNPTLATMNSNTVYQATNATAKGVRIVSVALGSNADTNLMRQLASSTNLYYYATNSTNLDQIYGLISGFLCRNTNLAPTVQIFNPTNGQIFGYPSTFPIQAIATDPRKSLVGVKFYADATFIGEDRYGQPNDFGTSTNSISWTPAAGTYSLTAVVSNSFGLCATSTAVSIIVNGSPTVSAGVDQTLIWTEGASITNVTLTGTVSDDGLPYHVTNFLWTVVSSNGAVVLSNATQRVASASFVTNGVYTFKLTVNDGFATNSSNCTVIIQRRPFVFITYPATNAVFNAGVIIDINASTYDLDGYVTNVQFFNIHNGVTNIIGTGMHVGTLGITNFYNFAWTNAPRGTNALFAIATDNDGLSKTSAPSVFMLVASNFNVVITHPTNNAVFVAPAIIPISALVSNANVTSVKFYTNGALLGEDLVGSGNLYEFTWFGASSLGTNLLQAIATDSLNDTATSSIVPIIIVSPVKVNPGTNRTLLITNSSVTITLNGSVSGGRGGSVTSYWNQAQIYGLPNVTFTNDVTNVTATVIFTNTGTYKLRLNAGDGYSADSDTVTISVLSNQPPVVIAGSDLTIQPGETVYLNGLIRDDNLPTPHVLTNTWRLVSGPTNNIHFTSSNLLAVSVATNFATTVTNFTLSGEYRFRLTANDGMASGSNDMTVYVVPVGGRTWTFDADFEEGALLNLNYDDVPDQLQLNRTIEPFPYVWVACSGRGTIARIDVNTGQVIGEYKTTPSSSGNGSPSRTTVDKHGNVWVANRIDDSYHDLDWNSYTGGSITRVGLVIGGTRGWVQKDTTSGNVTNFIVDSRGEYLKPPFKYCTAIDRDHDGYIRTSFGLTNILGWDDGNTNNTGGVSFADDECILNYTRVPCTGTRTIAVNPDNDVWVGGRYQGVFAGNWGQFFSKISGVTGEVITNTIFDVQSLGVTAYGGLVDGQGVLWSAGWDQRKLLRFDPSERATNVSYVGSTIDVSGSIYGIGIDPKTGNIWYSDYSGSRVVTLNPSDLSTTNYPTVGSNPKGVAVDNNGDVWVANTSDSTVSHFRTDGTFVGLVPLPCTNNLYSPMGVAIDANGKIWVAFESGHALRIDPTKGYIGFDGYRIGAVDMVVPLDIPGQVVAGSAPYNYSDMTGFVSIGSTQPSGTWTVIHDSGSNGITWGKIAWTGTTNSDTRIKVEMRAATNFTELNAATNFFVAVTNGISFTGVTGRVAEIRVTLGRDAGSTNTPSLQDLTLAPTGTILVTNQSVSLASSDHLGVFQNSATNIVDVLHNDAIFTGTNAIIVSWSPPVNGSVFTNSSAINTTNVYNVVTHHPSGTVIYYTPNPDFTGADRFTYTVTDGKGLWGRAVVNMTVIKSPLIVTNFADLPHPEPDQYQFNKNSVTNFMPVLNNDNNYVSILSFTQPPNGLVQRHPCGLLFTPNRNFTGTNVFTYTISGELGGRATTNVTVVVTNVPFPNFEVLFGTNKLHHGDTILLNVTGTNVSVTNTLTLTNSGEAAIWTGNWEINPVGGAYSIDNASLNADLDPNVSTNVIVIFNSDSVGQTNGFLLIHTNSSSGGSIRINFSALVRTPLSGPSIQITAPLTNAEFAGLTDITITATNSDHTATNVVFVYEPPGGPFYLIGQDATSPYSVIWKTAPAGSYNLYAWAYDANNNVGISAPVPIIVHEPPLSPTNAPPIARDNFRSIPLSTNGTESYAINVLDNDSDANRDPLTIVDFTEFGQKGRLSQSSNVLYYTPVAGRSGDDVMQYTISDGNGGVGSASIHIHIFNSPPPTITIISPTANFGHLPTNFVFLSTASAGVTNVTYYFDGTHVMGFSANGAGHYPVTWYAGTNLFAGQHYIFAIATDTNGLQGISQTIYIETVAPDWDQPPTAEISNFAPIEYDPDLQMDVQLPVIHEAITNLMGTASDPDPNTPLNPQNGGDVYYQVLVYDQGGRVVGNFTPSPDPVTGYHHGRVNDNVLATLDLTGLPNGTYRVELNVNDTWYEISTSKWFILDSDLKIGNFSFSVKDLVIPVNGIPLAVMRSYNSLNRETGAFGPSWAMALNDMDVRINEQREDVVDDYGDIVNLRVGGGYDVTLTLPNGRRTTFAFTPETGTYFVTPTWAPSRFVRETLTPLGNPRYDLLNQQWVANGWPCNILRHFDFPGWELATPDGTRYVIERDYLDEHDFLNGLFLEGGEEDDPTWGNGIGSLSIRSYGKARLARIIQRSGDRIEINENGVQHFDPLNNLTRAVRFDRDANGFITAIYDPNSGSNGLPVIKYKYGLASDGISSNLVQTLKLTDRNGSGGLGTYDITSYEYTNTLFPHFITGIIDPRGVRAIRTEYDADGRIRAMYDAFGNHTLYLHDSVNNIETIIDQLGHGTTNHYDSHGNVTAVVNALGQTNRFAYDDDKQVLLSVDAMGHTNSYGYDNNGYRSANTNALGEATHFDFDDFGQLRGKTNALMQSTSFDYDSSGHRTAVEDALHHSTKFNHDIHGRPTEVTNALNQLRGTAGSDDMGDLQFVSQAGGIRMDFAHDLNGNTTNTSFVWVNPDNTNLTQTLATITELDAENRVTRVTDPDGRERITIYDETGRVAKNIDRIGNTNSYLYDAMGNTMQTTDPDGTISRTVYDERSQALFMVDRHLPGTPANGTHNVYDSLGRLVRTERIADVQIDIDFAMLKSVLISTGALLSASSTVYDDAGRVRATTNVLGRVTQYEYDAVGRKTAVIDALTNRTDSVYDAAGRLRFVTNALQQVTEYQYDPKGRRIKTIFPNQSYITNSYNEIGKLMFVIDQVTNRTDYEYDNLGRVKTVIKPQVFDPEGGTNARPRWEYEYDSLGNLLVIRDPKRRETKFTYDKLGELISKKLPLQQTNYHVYNALGQLDYSVDFKGQTNRLVYDSLGRVVTNFLYAAGASVPSQTNVTEYGPGGQYVRTTRPEGVTTLSYNLSGAVTNVVSPEGAINYEYDSAAGYLKRAYTVNSDMQYDYDELGRLKTVKAVERNGTSLPTPEVTTNTYTKLGSLENVYLPNGTRTFHQYDALNHLTNMVHYDSANNLLARYEYTVAPNGQRLAAKETRLEIGGGYSTTQIAWTNDALRRLVRESSSSTVTALSFTNNYVYDLAGNRLWKTNVSGAITVVTAYTNNANDQLLGESSSAGSFTNYYDTGGSLTNRSSGAETNLYAYNLEGRLASAVVRRLEGSDVVVQTNRYYYNGSGIRVREETAHSVNGGAVVNETNIFLNDAQNLSGFSQVLEELPAVGALPRVSYTLGNQIISQEKNGTNSYLMFDGHSSTRLLTDTNSVISDRYSYDGYGLPLDLQFGVVNPPRTKMLYTGEQFDVGLQQYYLRARYYNPTVGRFGVQDQLDGNTSDPLSLHKYAYCQNDPINGRDPSGNEDLISLTFTMAIGVAGELWKNREVLWKGGKLITEGLRAGETLGKIDAQDPTPDVDTATIIVHGLNGGFNGQPNGWSLGFSGDLNAKAGTPSQQAGGLRGGVGGATLAGAGLNQDFYEFNWGGMSFANAGLVPIEPVHQMAFVHLQMAQMLVWMKGYSDINVISHSWGTLLSYDLLNAGGIEMHHWVTMGSPLKKTTDKPFWVTGSWINCYSVFDPVTHFEIFPPFMSGLAMAPNVIIGWGRANAGIFGDGLTVDPNVDAQRPYIMGLTGIDEHGAYWNWAPCLNDLRKDLQ